MTFLMLMFGFSDDGFSDFLILEYFLLTTKDTKKAQSSLRFSDDGFSDVGI
jgi:hypothetical protein